MTARAALIGAAALGVAWLVARGADAAAAAAYEVTPAVPGQARGELPNFDDVVPAVPALIDYLNPWGAMERLYERTATAEGLQDRNVAAFLSLIEYAEGTGRDGRDPYRTCYGYKHTIQSLADHPAVTREWKGESIASLGPQYAGMVSTAAGRYQIIRPTWLEAKRALQLADFSPASQDAAAVWLIRRRGALDDVKAGRIAQAVELCRAEWASLPGAGYGQPERKMAELIGAYSQAGGALA